MSAPIPEDLRSVYEDATADGERMSEWRSSFVRSLIERIAALEAQVRQLRETLQELCAGGEPSTSAWNRAVAALAATELKEKE